MTYYVPTRGRTHLPPATLGQLRAAGILASTVIVCPVNEVVAWSQQFPDATVQSQPSWVSNIGQCRTWIFQSCPTRYLFWFDDDLSLSAPAGQRANPAWLRDILTRHVPDLFHRYPATPRS